MVPRRIVNLVSAAVFTTGLIIAGTVFAAAPPPPDDPPVESPTALWVSYDIPELQWYVLDDFDTREDCEKALPAALKVKPLPKEAKCIRVGVPANDMHPEFGSLTAKPPAKSKDEGGGEG